MSTSLLTVGDYIAVTMEDAINRQIEVVGIIKEIEIDAVLIYWGTSDNVPRFEWVAKERVHEWAGRDSHISLKDRDAGSE